MVARGPEMRGARHRSTSRTTGRASGQSIPWSMLRTTVEHCLTRPMRHSISQAPKHRAFVADPSSDGFASEKSIRAEERRGEIWADRRLFTMQALLDPKYDPEKDWMRAHSETSRKRMEEKLQEARETDPAIDVRLRRLEDRLNATGESAVATVAEAAARATAAAGPGEGAPASETQPQHLPDRNEVLAASGHARDDGISPGQRRGEKRRPEEVAADRDPEHRHIEGDARVIVERNVEMPAASDAGGCATNADAASAPEGADEGGGVQTAQLSRVNQSPVCAIDCHIRESLGSKVTENECQAMAVCLCIMGAAALRKCIHRAGSRRCAES